jgi:biopolymer transport protein ExbB
MGINALPGDLSPWSMYLNADPVVKGILVGLTLASVATWTVWLAKSFELIIAKRVLRKALHDLRARRALAEASPPGGRGVVPAMLQTAATELELSAPIPEGEGIRERIALGLSRIEAEHGRRMMRGTGVLATIGATAPFVGLFGTVWGIMNSFVNIAKLHTTNLAVVAPGIAEALLATAVGLAAAIPAVVIYNIFARSIAGYKAMLSDAAAEVLRLASRDQELARVTMSGARHARSNLSAAE